MNAMNGTNTMNGMSATGGTSVKVLALQGGGTRGIMQAIILAALEAKASAGGTLSDIESGVPAPGTANDGGLGTSPRPSPHLTPRPLSNAEGENCSQPPGEIRAGESSAGAGSGDPAYNGAAGSSASIFSLIGGTSVGSIIGGCIAAGVPAADLVKFFTCGAPRIFTGPGSWSWNPARLLRAAKYSPDRLKAELETVAGNKTLRDCRTHFIATAFEMRSGRIAYFQSYGKSSTSADEIVIGPDQDISLVDVMMASSAAQSYFPGHAWGPYLFYDGGNTGFNAPDMLVLQEAKALFPLEFNSLEMLSLGCGNTPWPYGGANGTNPQLINPGLASVAKITANIAYFGPEMGEVWMTRCGLGQRYFRLNPAIPAIAIDDASEPRLLLMESAAGQELKNHPEVLQTFN
jgi:hypothetical protein